MNPIVPISVSVALAAVAVTGSPASAAAAADPTCPFTRTVCLWDGAGYTGSRLTVQSADPATPTCVDLAAHGWPDGRVRSARNTGTRPAVLHTGRDCTGTAYQLIPQGGYGTVTFGSNSILVY